MEVRRWQAQQSRYFSDPGAIPPPAVQQAFAEAAAARGCRPRLTCCGCYGEGHDLTTCPHSGVSCTSCGGTGHPANACPIYLMDLSIRGSLANYVQQQRKKATAENGETTNAGVETITSSNRKLGSKTSKPIPEFSVQCVVCGRYGHANCSEPPLARWIAYCARCAQLGHSAASCTRISSSNRFSRPSLLQEVKTDSWKLTAKQGWGSDRGGGGRLSSSLPFKHKPVDHKLLNHQPSSKTMRKSKKHMASSARAAADPWHPSHLR